MRSKALLVVAAVDAEKKKWVRTRHPLAELMGTAAGGSWYHKPEELVPVRAKGKSKPGFRVCCEFGPRYRMRHEALRAIYTPSLKPAPFQYDAGNKAGVPHAIKDIKAAIANGYVWAVSLDIEGFFQHFTKEGLVELLQLQEKVVTNYALGINLQCKPCVSPLASLAEIIFQARRGGPQGSAFSSLLALMIISHLKWEGTALLFNWADNFLILAKTKEGAEKASIALISKTGALPGGHFTLKVEQKRHVTAGIRFLGHNLILKGAILRVTPARPEEFIAALTKLDNQIQAYVFGTKKNLPGAKERATDLLGDAWLLIRSWESFFRECDPVVIAEYTDWARAALKMDWFVPLKMTPCKIEAYQNPEVTWDMRYS